MPAPGACVVPTIVQYEVVKWLHRMADEARADAFLAYTMECQVEALDTETALIAASLSAEFKLAMADAIVLATARKAGASLLTCDAHFERVPDVTFVRKTGH
jgi:predicted nucleic acid-binding protein